MQINNIDINMSEEDYLKLRKYQNELMNMIDEFNKFCDEKELNFILGYGGLIGLKLFDGFLPWDDDLDCLMSRNDYEKLESYCGKSIGNNKDIYIDNFSKSNYIKLLRKLEDGTEVFIDITPLDFVPNNLILRKIVLVPCYFYFIPYYIKLKLINKPVEKILNYILPSFEFLNRRRNQWQKRINEWFKDSNKLAQLSDCVDLQKSVFEKNDIYPFISVIFENKELKVPANVEGFLSSRYGKWGLPKFEDRKPPHLNIHN